MLHSPSLLAIYVDMIQIVRERRPEHLNRFASLPSHAPVTALSALLDELFPIDGGWGVVRSVEAVEKLRERLA